MLKPDQEQFKGIITAFLNRLQKILVAYLGYNEDQWGVHYSVYFPVPSEQLRGISLTTAGSLEKLLKQFARQQELVCECVERPSRRDIFVLFRAARALNDEAGKGITLTPDQVTDLFTDTPTLGDAIDEVKKGTRYGEFVRKLREPKDRSECL